jgi:dihydrofolate synthase / folylpolyglutamate synthase
MKQSQMNFQESVEYLLSLGNEVSAMKLGLENIRRLLTELGDPHKKYLKVQVAGTNGKGSVCAFLNSICLEAGIETGMYTSPHLVSITERVKINGIDIAEKDFARLATEVRTAAESLAENSDLDGTPTFFEQVTAIALLAFAEKNVEVAILETGLGGRLDATTAADAEIAAITRIDLDHQKYLGNTIEEIAAEKAAIIREGSRVIIGDQDTDAIKVISDRCRLVGVEPMLARETLVFEGGNTSGSECANAMGIETRSPPVVFPPLGLAGLHQFENAQIAAAIAVVLREYFPISDTHIASGLEHASHPGRLELAGQFLFDGAHNIGGAKALRAFLDEFIDSPITMVFGSMEDKDIAEIASILFPRATRLILTRPRNSRAQSPDRILLSMPADIDRDHVYVIDNVEDAIAKAEAISESGDLVLVTGSLYLIGDVKKLLARETRI